jgi:hypothetical protein
MSETHRASVFSGGRKVGEIIQTDRGFIATDINGTTHGPVFGTQREAAAVLTQLGMHECFGCGDL